MLVLGCTRFPVLFEYLPYRKDDSFLYRDCPYFAYFASRGFVVAKVDIRGTGSSFGKLIHREYTNQELDDGAEIINQLAKMPWSNGNVGMYDNSVLMTSCTQYLLHFVKACLASRGAPSML